MVIQAPKSVADVQLYTVEMTQTFLAGTVSYPFTQQLEIQVVPACDERNWLRDDAESAYVMLEGSFIEFLLPLGLFYDESKVTSWSEICGYAKSEASSLFKY